MLDVLNIPAGDIFKACPGLKDIPCFVDFRTKAEKAPKEDRVPVRETILYVYLLYTKDSFINKKPPEPLQTRNIKAAKLAGLNPDDEAIRKAILELENDSVRGIVADYLIFQNVSRWSNRCVIEAQMAENLRIRLTPIENGRADKEILNKHVLTEHYNDYEAHIKNIDLDMFLDHDAVRDFAVKKRTTLESLVK